MAMTTPMSRDALQRKERINRRRPGRAPAYDSVSYCIFHFPPRSWCLTNVNTRPRPRLHNDSSDIKCGPNEFSVATH